MGVFGQMLMIDVSSDLNLLDIDGMASGLGSRCPTMPNISGTTPGSDWRPSARPLSMLFDSDMRSELR